VIETGQNFEIAVEGAGAERGFPDFDAWRLEIGAVSEILAAIDEQIHSKQSITWRLVDLHHSTPTIALRPEWDAEIFGRPIDAVMNMWFSAIGDLRNGKDPEALGAPAIDAIRKAMRPIGNRLKIVKFDYDGLSDHFDVDVAAAIAKIQFKTETSDEDWEGSLDELNLHNSESWTFRLYPAVSKGARWITCEFKQEQEELVHSLLKRKVSVFGEAIYRPKENLPHRIKVRNIEQLDDEDLEPLSKFSGLASIEETDKLFGTLFENRRGW
jgi:hypothetical protein